MKSYYRVMLGKKSMFADQCKKGEFIGLDFGLREDLSENAPDIQPDFNAKYRPIWLKAHPEKTKIAAGGACSFLHTISKHLQIGDIVICPNGQNEYLTGEVVGPYEYHPDTELPHRRKVHWYPTMIERATMSTELQGSTRSVGALVNITKYSEEINRFLDGNSVPALVHTDVDVEDPSVFALEKHLEEFLIANWKNTELGRDYDIYEEEGELVGQQFQSDTGPIDILAVRKDKSELLVIELKKGRASDVVVGQIQRYMGYVIEELAEEGQEVRGIIIALEDDLKIRRALRVARGIDFYRYQVSFTLSKA